MPDPVLESVGPRLRAIRSRRSLTLEQLAERTGISVSTLSRLESGLRKPTLELLLPLAREYRVPLDELVGAPAVGDPRIHPRPVHRNGRTWIELTRNPDGFNAFKVVLPVTGPVERQQRTHPGYEWLYVITGRVRLSLGSDDFELASGEVAEFDTSSPHAITNAGDVPAETLIIFSHNGERLHMRDTGAEQVAS